jgi:hypothetical protein
MPARIEQLVLPGTELEVRPLDDRRAPVIVRMLASYPHGTAWRYDLEYYGLDPGTFDLKDFLRRKNGSDAADLPAIPVIIETILPPGQIKPHAPEIASERGTFSYRTAIWLAAGVWLLGFVAILFAGRHRRHHDEDATKPVTLADHLRPLVVKATSGELSNSELADLERSLLAYWRRRLGYDHCKPNEASALLQANADAGPLLLQLEAWLHRPAATPDVDVSSLLQPYQNLPVEEFVHGAGITT